MQQMQIKEVVATDLCLTVPLPADGREATALPGLRAAPTDVALADAGYKHTQHNTSVFCCGYINC